MYESKINILAKLNLNENQKSPAVNLLDFLFLINGFFNNRSSYGYLNCTWAEEDPRQADAKCIQNRRAHEQR